MKDAAIRAEARSPDFRFAGVQSAGECIGTLEPGCRVIGLTKGQFSLLDLLRAILAQTGPAHVTLATWTVGIRDAENAAWLLSKGDLLSFRLLTDRSFVVRKPKYAARLQEVFGQDAIRATRVHAKFALVRNDAWDVCVRSSMNLNRNRRWEQFDLDDDAAICDHFHRLVAEMERLMVPGTRPTHQEVTAAFDAALEPAAGDGTAALVDALTDIEHLARLGYTLDEIAGRLERTEDATDFERGSWALDDQVREAVISAALGGCLDSRKRVSFWLERQAARGVGE